MIYTFKECKEKYGTLYMINKAVKNEELYKIERGFYSDQPREPEISLISIKYPDAVFTMNSAFYYHNLTDTIPDKYFLVTDKDAATISDKRVVQKYEIIKIYSKERMLLELIRNKNNMPFYYYKEILNNYRKIVYDLNIQDIQDYANELPKNKMIMETLRLEVF